MAEFLHNHQSIDARAERVAHSIDIVARKVDQHDVLGAVLERVAEFVRQGFVCFGRGATFDGAGDGVGDDAAFFGFDEEFGAGTDKLEVSAAVDVEEVGGGVDGAEVAIYIKGVE